jgi:hypothetical protein
MRLIKMISIVECIEVKHGFWKNDEQYEVKLTWDSNSRYLHTLDELMFDKFWNFPKDDKGYY